jgi:hypothetical protein
MMRDGQVLPKISAPLFLMKAFQLTLLFARSISMDSGLKPQLVREQVRKGFFIGPISQKGHRSKINLKKVSLVNIAYYLSPIIPIHLSYLSNVTRTFLGLGGFHLLFLIILPFM